MMLFGNSQEDDLSMIADLVVSKLEVYCKPVLTSISKTTSVGALAHYSQNGASQSDSWRPNPSNGGGATAGTGDPQPGRRASHASHSSTQFQPSPGRPYGSGSANTTPQRQPLSNMSAATSNDRSVKVYLRSAYNAQS